MFYAAKEFVEKIARRIGHAEGRRGERQRINQAVAAQGIPISPELTKILADDPS